MWYWPGAVPARTCNRGTHRLDDRAVEFRFAPRRARPAHRRAQPAPSATRPPARCWRAHVASRTAPRACRRCPSAARAATQRGRNRDPAGSFAASCAPRSAPTRPARLASARSCSTASSDRSARRPQEGRTIVFTDSRDDAAGTAAGVELNHFRDLVRQLVDARAASAPTRPLELLQARGRGEALSDDERRTARRAQGRRRPISGSALRARGARRRRAPSDERDRRSSRTPHGGGVAGVCVGGAAPARIERARRARRQPRRARARRRRPSPDGHLVAAVHAAATGSGRQLDRRGARRRPRGGPRATLDRHLADALFNRGGRDFESIGLGLARAARADRSSALPAGDETRAARGAALGDPRARRSSGRYPGTAGTR